MRFPSSFGPLAMKWGGGLVRVWGGRKLGSDGNGKKKMKKKKMEITDHSFSDVMAIH